MRVTQAAKPSWRAHFDADTPNDVILLSALSGRCPSISYLDRSPNPQQIVVRAHGGKAFASTCATEVFLHDVVDQFGALGWTALVDTGLPESIQSRGRAVARIRFDLPAESLAGLRGSLPPDMTIQPLDRELLERCQHASRELAKCYGRQIDNYFSFGYGICLLSGEDVVCEAYACYVAEGRAEAVVGTAEPFRGKGLASLAAALLAEESRKRGDEFTWNCLADNVGSSKVARRLGFRRERPYREIYF